MSLGNTTLWGDILPGGSTEDDDASGLDTAQVIDEALPSLHAESRATLHFWSERSIIETLDEAVKRLAAKACVFIGRTQQLTAPQQQTYTLPNAHLATLHLAVSGVPLLPASALELEARDDTFRSRLGEPTDWFEDLLGERTFGLSPIPIDELPVTILYAGWPSTLDAGKQQTTIPAPAPVKGYLAMALLAETYGRESDLEMPEVAAHCAGRMGMYESVFENYYGKTL